MFGLLVDYNRGEFKQEPQAGVQFDRLDSDAFSQPGDRHGSARYCVPVQTVDRLTNVKFTAISIFAHFSMVLYFNWKGGIGKDG